MIVMAVAQFCISGFTGLLYIQLCSWSLDLCAMTCVKESLKLLCAEIVHYVLLIAIVHGLWPDLNF